MMRPGPYVRAVTKAILCGQGDNYVMFLPMVCKGRSPRDRDTFDQREAFSNVCLMRGRQARISKQMRHRILGGMPIVSL